MFYGYGRIHSVSGVPFVSYGIEVCISDGLYLGLYKANLKVRQQVMLSCFLFMLLFNILLSTTISCLFLFFYDSTDYLLFTHMCESRGESGIIVWGLGWSQQVTRM